MTLAESIMETSRLGEILVQAGLVPLAGLEFALRRQALERDVEGASRNLGDVLVDAALVTPSDVERAAAWQRAIRSGAGRRALDAIAEMTTHAMRAAAEEACRASA